MNSNESAWERVQKQFTTIGKLLELDPAFVSLFLKPEHIVEVSLPLERDNKQIEIIKGVRVQHNSLRGPYKGGLRFHHEVSIDEMKTLSFLMSIKNALVEVPFGGGKGGLKVNPKNLSEKELERLTRLFAKQLAPSIGPDVDIPAPDVNTGPAIMSWMVDEYKKHTTHKTPHAGFTGKPISEGGSQGRTEATGLGGAFVLLQTLKHLQKSPEGMTVAVQGFGNVGYHVAYFLQKHGMRIVALSDSKGGIYVPEGIENIETLYSKRKEKGSFKAMPGEEKQNAQDITTDEVLTLPVDVVIPAALENVITEEVVKNMQASIVLEMANAPTTAGGEQVANERGILVIPDVLANAGGVAVSYFEWLQNMKDETWTKDQVFTRLRQKMDLATDAVFEAMNSFDVSMREAGFIVAIKRIESAWKKQSSEKKFTKDQPVQDFNYFQTHKRQ